MSKFTTPKGSVKDYFHFMDICEFTRTYNWNLKRHPWERVRLQIIRSFLFEYLNKNPNAGYFNIIDIGSGDAYMAHQLAENNNYTFYCIDPAYTHNVKETLTPNLHSSVKLFSSLNEAGEHNENLQFDAILLLDVIEHVENDYDLIHTIQNSINLKKEALFVITVPAYSFLFSNHDIYLKHYRRYTSKRLYQLCRSLNLDVTESGYFFFTLFILRTIQVHFFKDSIKQEGISNYKYSKIKDILFYYTLRIDYLFGKLLRKLKITLPGLSCYIVCRQKS